MNATPTHGQPAAGDASAASVPRTVADLDERGQLTIGPLVLRKVAEHAADLTPGVLPHPRTVAGLHLGSTGATAKVTVADQRVDLHVELGLRYPNPVRATVAQVRTRIGDEVRRITGCQVRSITVIVSALLPDSILARSRESEGARR